MLHVLNSADEAPPPSPNRAAIVSLVIGADYELAWERLCRDGWVAYGERIGADVVILKERIDKGDVARSPAWQKLLIPELSWASRYERLIWLDSDIIIMDDAPDILQFCGPLETVSLCEDAGRLSPAEGQLYLESVLKVKLSPDSLLTAWPIAQKERYIANSAPPHAVQFNTGVMVLSPAHHAGIFRSVYPCPQVSTLYEQPHLSHALLERGVAYTLSPRFNWGLVESMQLYIKNGLTGDEAPEFLAQIIHVLVRAEMRNAYFLHFYGAMRLLKHYATNPLFDRPPPLAAAA